MKPWKKVAVIGAGTMGHGIAQFFASRGVQAAIVDEAAGALDKARQMIRENLARMVELGEMKASEVDGVIGRIRFEPDLAAALDGAELVIEAVSENLDLKRSIFARLDELADPRTALASNTSSYDINEFSAAAAHHPERVLGTHWFHPPQIVPCVEVISARETDPEVTARVVAGLEALGKAPTTCKSSPGFVGNRIQFALVAEALAIVAEGLATPEEVDRIVKTSFGFRLGAFGPCEVIDQAGIDIYRAVFEYFHEKFPDKQVFNTPAILSKLAGEGRLGLKSGAGFYEYGPEAADRLREERDRKLYARLRLHREESGTGGAAGAGTEGAE